jgi:hypothetical protein
MNRTARRIAASVTLALATVGLAGTAHAATVASADRTQWKAALTGCKSVTDDVAYQDCVTGSVMNALHRGLRDTDYEVTASGSLRQTHATRAIGNRRYAPTTADKAAMARANVDCESVTMRTDAWESCVFGAFASDRPGHVATDRDTFVLRVKAKGNTWTYREYLRNGSHAV